MEVIIIPEGKVIAGAIILLITAAFLALIGLGVDIPAINLMGQQSYLYYKWLIYFFQFQWVDYLIESFQYFSYEPMLAVMSLISIVAFCFIFVALILFIVGMGMAFGDQEGSAGMAGAIFFTLSVGLNIFALIYGVTSIPDPFGFMGGTIQRGILTFIDSTAIIVIVLGFIGAGLIESGETGW